MTNLPSVLNSNIPELEDIKAQIKKEVMMDIMCHHVGIIESFDAAKQMATVRIVYKRTFFRQLDSGLVNADLIPYPTLVDVPVVFLRGGPAKLRFPVAAGDECLLLFADRDIDNWLMTGDSEGGCNTLRMHSVSDAVALVGLASIDNVIPSFPADRGGLIWGEGENAPEAFVSAAGAALQRGDTKVIAGAKVTFENATTTLKTELQALIDQLTSLNGYLSTLITTTSAITVMYAPGPGGPVPSGPPVNAAAFPPIAINISNVTTALGNIKTKIGELLV